MTGGPAPGAGNGRLRVLSVPAGHVYVRHLSDPAGTDAVDRLPDPQPPGAPPGARWWPPPALEAGWVREHAGEFDLCHVHFGFDARSPEQLQALVDALRDSGRPLVYTVHDLSNPHHDDPTLHSAQLDVLVPAADALVTLTPGAAAEIRRRWGREARVVPHPHVAEDAVLRRPRPRRAEFVVGLHLKSLRANMDPVGVLEPLLEVVPSLPRAVLRVDAHTDVMTPGFTRHDPALAALLRSAAEAGRLELHVHDFFDDEAFFAYLQAIDLSVLPYRFGTHSGWLEACYDVGTRVLAPDCGFYAEQQDCLVFRAEGPQRGASIGAGVRAAHAATLPWRADPEARAEERRRVAAEHRRIYESVLGLSTSNL